MARKGICKEIDTEIKKFDDEMRLRNFTDATTRTYRYIVRKFLQSVKKSPRKVCDIEVRGYMLDLSNRGVSNSYFNQQSCAITLYLESCRKMAPSEINLPPRKSESRVAQMISEAEIHKIIMAADEGLERTILLFIYATGARSSEAAKIETADIGSARMVISIHQGKGKKDRVVPLSPSLLLELRNYYKKYHPGRWLFPRPDKLGPIKGPDVAAIWKRARDKSGVKCDLGVHSLRHAFATGLLEKGLDIRSLQQILGHSSIMSTARYLRMTNTISMSCGDKIDAMLRTISSGV